MACYGLVATITIGDRGSCLHCLVHPILSPNGRMSVMGGNKAPVWLSCHRVKAEMESDFTSLIFFTDFLWGPMVPWQPGREPL